MPANRFVQLQIKAILLCCLAIPFVAFAQGPSRSGDFPFDEATDVFSGPLLQSGRSDLLVQWTNGNYRIFQNDRYSSHRLALLSFDGSQFHKVWADSEMLNNYSDPEMHPAPEPTYCFGNFENNGKYSIIISDSSGIRQIKFDDNSNGVPTIRKLKVRHIIIDQAIGSDIDGDNVDEVVTMEYPNDQDTCCIKGHNITYHLGIYKIQGDSLAQLWHGLAGVGGNFAIVPPDQFISKCHIDSIPGDVPVIQGPQSDMSVSFYHCVRRMPTGNYEKIKPFPYHPAEYIRKPEIKPTGEEAEKFKEIVRQAMAKEVGPIGGVIFNDGSKVLHYGYFLDHINPDPQQRMPRDQFSILENGQWNRLEKTDSLARGMMCNFTIEPGKSGWLFIHDGKYYFYDKLPLK